jgi:hypothetical protein
MERNVKALTGIVEFGTDIGELEFGADAEQLWEDHIWDEIDARVGEGELMEDFAGRAMPYCWRIAGLYAIARKSRIINAKDLESAYGLIKYMLGTVEYVFEEYAVDVTKRQVPDRKIEEAPFAGDPRLAREKDIKRLVDIAREAGEEGQKSGKFLQLVKRYKASGGKAGAPTYFIVYTGNDETASVPVVERVGARVESPAAEAPKTAKRAEKPIEVIEERATPEPSMKAAPKRATRASRPAIQTTPLPPRGQAAPRQPMTKVNGSNDLLAGFFG